MSGEFSVGKSGGSRRWAKVLAAVLITFGALWASACGSDDAKGPPPARKCTLNSDCDSQLVCSFGLCHTQCKESKDCSAGQLCVKADISDDGGVCQLDQQSECKFADDCPDPLVCGPDSKCRTPCRYPSARDCLPKQVCAKGGVCAETDEVDEKTGGIKGAPIPDGGTGGGPNTDGGDECVAGGSCVLDGSPCRAGTYACVSGERVCQDSGAATDGTACGVDQVCVSGNCTDCVQDAACTPDENDPCKVGTQDCSQGVRCIQGANAADGVNCGSDKVCSGGTCVDCVQDEDCEPEEGDGCDVGKRDCSKGPVCEKTDDAADGTSCGTNRVCNGGSCVTCFAGGSCEPSNECHTGRRTCTSGPACEDTGESVNDGKACSTPGEYCVNGACKACTQGDPCTPTTDKCKNGYTYCSGGVATCSALGTNAPDGKFCADDETSACFSGVCTPLDRTIVVKSGGQPTGLIGQFATNVVVTVRDKNNAGVPNVVVRVLDSDPAGGSGLQATTNASGDATVRLRLGTTVGSYKFTITATAVAAPLEVTATATAPAAGTIYSVVNADHIAGNTGTPGAGTNARVNTARGLAIASDGTAYVADYYAVYKLTPAGQLTVVAGKPGQGGVSGDGGKAVDALLQDVRALALDETNKLLHIATFQGRVRTVSLTTGDIGTTAGGTSTTAPPQDVGASPLDLNLSNVFSISLSPAGELFIVDGGHSRIVKVDTSNQTSEWLKTGNCNANETVFSGFYDGTQVAWDAAGKPFVSGYFCNLGINQATAVTSYGVVRVDTVTSPAPRNVLVHVAGWNSTGSKSNGVPSTNAYFTSVPRIAFDKAGNLYVSLAGDEVIRRIDSATFRITTVAGAPATNPVVYGDYGPATSAQFSNVGAIAFNAANTLYLADTSNNAIRAVWGLGLTTASTYVLTKNGGDNQTSVPLDAPFAPLSVKLVDGAGAVIPNVPVEWVRKETGSYVAERFTPTSALAGVSTNTGRVGLLAGAYTFDAWYTDLHGSKTTLTFTATAVAPTAGHIYTVVNTSNVSGTTTATGAGTAARTQYNEDIVPAADGSLYLSNYYAIYTLTPRGELSLFAGAPGQGGSVGQGNAGPALNARFSHVQGMALDETRKRLYVTDGGSRVRLIDLNTPERTIDALAGGGATGQVDYGDNKALSEADFSSMDSISLAADGKSLYGVDRGHNRIREIQIEVAAGTPTTKTVLVAGGGCQANVISMSSLHSRSRVLWLPSGEAYISGNICGTKPNNGALGIVKRATNGTLTLVAGSSNTAATSDGIPADTAYFGDIGGLAVDSAGNLYVAQYTQHKIRKITFSGGAGTISTIAGTGTATGANPAPDYIPALTSTLENPEGLAIVRRASGDRLVIGDYSNNAFREVW